MSGRTKSTRKRAARARTASRLPARVTRKTARSARTVRVKVPKRTVPRVPRRQLELPCGYHAEGGGVASFRDVMSPDVQTVDGDALTDTQRKKLALLRVEAQPDLQLLTSGVVIDKGLALREIRRNTPLGRILVEVEHQAIAFLRNNARAQQRARAARRRKSKATPKRRPRTRR